MADVANAGCSVWEQIGILLSGFLILNMKVVRFFEQFLFPCV